MPSSSSSQHAYIITVDMGYGHQRASYPLRDIAACPPEWDHGEPMIIPANTYPGIPRSDQKAWEGSRKLYETISRFKKVPIFGSTAFKIMDYVQRIEPFYPDRDLSAPTLQVKQIYRMIKRKQWGKHLIDSLNQDPKPLITTFFIPAFFAEEHGYRGDIYCLCTDTDVSRAWVPLNPSESRIKYFAPTKRVKERLIRYGVRSDHIFITGFPLPKETVGARSTNHTLKQALGCRISNLDPNGIYQKKYETILTEYLGARYCSIKAKHPFTIMFAVGGAGAQREIGIEILKSLRHKIEACEMRLILVAGSRQDVFRYYESEIKRLDLMDRFQDCLQIVYHENKSEYFKKFNQALLTTDVLWTKPSELSFYTALGIPIIMCPSVGSQEDYNRRWLYSVGSGMEQLDPAHCSEWLEDWMESGGLAQAAMEGFLDAPCNGVYHIEDIVMRGKVSEVEDMHLM